VRPSLLLCATSPVSAALLWLSLKLEDNEKFILNEYFERNLTFSSKLNQL
jgi:hypothetical protein